MKKTFFYLMVAFFAIITMNCSVFADSITANVTEIRNNPALFNNKQVCVSGFFSIWKNAPGAPPVSRSDWVLCDSDKNGIYCVGSMPADEETGEIEPYWKPIEVNGVVEIKDGEPFIHVTSTKVANPKIEQMVSVRQIILNQHEMIGKYVGIMGVLAKGHGIKGDRMYLIADPTGAIRIGKTTKLYPKGTIIHIRGTVTNDEYGMPMIDQVEVISAKVD